MIKQIEAVRIILKLGHEAILSHSLNIDKNVCDAATITFPYESILIQWSQQNLDHTHQTKVSMLHYRWQSSPG